MKSKSAEDARKMKSLNILTEERLRVCDICEHKTPDWKCGLSKENLPIKARVTEERCPSDKWGKSFFSNNPTLTKILSDNNLIGPNGQIKTEGIEACESLKDYEDPHGTFPAHFNFIKKSLSLRPVKYLLQRESSISDIIYCVNNDPPGNWPADFHTWDNVQEAFRRLLGERAIKVFDEEYPKERFHGKGIVVCGGGVKYFPSVYVNLRILRLLGCKLPVEVFYLGVEEMDLHMIRLLESLEDVKCINGRDLESKYPIRIHAGWESKIYSIMNSSFEEVLMLDADNTPLINPIKLFNEKPYLDSGAIFWPDFACWKHDEHIWKILGIMPYNELQFESGQVLVNKSRCWRELSIAKHFCDYSDYYFKLFYGDKEAFHFGWRFFGSHYGFPPTPDWINNSIIVQKNLNGSWLFSHRAQAKFKLDRTHKISREMPYEQDTLDILEELSTLWSGTIWKNHNPSSIEKKLTDSLVDKTFKYHRVGLDERNVKFLANNKTGDPGRLEKEWYVFVDKNGEFMMSIIGENNFVTAILKLDSKDNVWKGKWTAYERCPIELTMLD